MFVWLFYTKNFHLTSGLGAVGRTLRASNMCANLAGNGSVRPLVRRRRSGVVIIYPGNELGGCSITICLAGHNGCVVRHIIGIYRSRCIVVNSGHLRGRCMASSVIVNILGNFCGNNGGCVSLRGDQTCGTCSHF